VAGNAVHFLSTLRQQLVDVTIGIRARRATRAAIDPATLAGLRRSSVTLQEI